MIKDSQTINQRHKKFIRTICETQIVYALQHDEGFATSSSVHYEDDEGDPIDLICFWSESAMAKSCIKEDWGNYEVAELSLSDFLENWCVGMYQDAILVGTNFDSQMFGYEAEPLELLKEALELLIENNVALDLKKYDNLEDFLEEVDEVLGDAE